MWIGFVWFRIRPNVGNETSDSIKGGKLLDVRNGCS
jgi:hypothetical protein